MIRHLPNLLSALRLAAAPLTAWLIVIGHDTAALILFAAASASDAADGFIARHWRFSSRFGAGLDPVADKLLMLFCYGALMWIGVAPPWLVLLVVARDAAIALGWLLARLFALPLRLEPLIIGKISTLVQMAYILLALLLLALDRAAPGVMPAAALVCALFTLLSAGAYGAVLLRGVFTGARAA